VKTLSRTALAVKPATPKNPRDSWPDWTEDDRWKLGPDPYDEARPTSGPEFIPSPDDLAASVALLNARATDYWPEAWPDLMEVSTVSDWDYHSELAELAELAERAQDAEGGVL
jgi:hypothetical protein